MSLEKELLEQEALTFEFAGKLYTKESFAEENDIPEDEIEGVIAILVTQGSIQYRKIQEPKRNKAIEKARKEALIIRQAQIIEEEKGKETLYDKYLKRDGRHTYEKVSFDFANITTAKEFLVCVQNISLGAEIIYNDKTEGFMVTVYDLTDKDLDHLSLIYKTDRMVKKTVGIVDTIITKTTSATDYTARKVVAPVTKIGLTGIFSLGKTLVTTATKVGSTVIAEGIKGTRETADALKNDQSLVTAKAELYQTKAEIQSMFNKGKHVHNGITIS